MKKNLVILCSIFILIIAVFFGWYVDKSKENRLIANYNSGYEIYTKKEITGVDITTIINKAVDNNEKYSILKDDKNLYISDDKYCTKVYIKVVDEKDVFPMEAFEKVGITKFTRAYGGAKFKCTNIEYHKNGRISKINFEIVN